MIFSDKRKNKYKLQNIIFIFKYFLLIFIIIAFQIYFLWIHQIILKFTIVATIVKKWNVVVLRTILINRIKELKIVIKINFLGLSS